MDMAGKTNIVVLGAGYAGLVSASKLAKEVGTDNANITLVSRHDYHYQTTWLHEPAAGTLHHDRTRIKVSKILDLNKINFVQDEALKVVTEEKKVTLASGGELQYDYIIVGVGAISETFGIEGVYENSYHRWTVDGARQMKDRIEYMFARYHSDEAKDEDLTFVVAGAGFTGMEFMGELSERVPKLCKEYDVPRNKVKMYVIEAMPTALPGFDPELVEYAMNLLENRGVEFKLDSPIKSVTENSVELNTGESVKTSTVIWATGVRGNPLIEESGFENNRARVKVDDDLRAPGHEREFIIGDCSLIINTEIDRPFPPTAQIALQQGETAADNIKALMEGRPTEAFVADIKGTVASLGGKEAIGVVGSKKLYGRPAYFMKKVIENRALWVLGGFGFLLRKGQSPF